MINNLIHYNDTLDHYKNGLLRILNLDENSFKVVSEVEKSDFKYQKISDITSLELMNHYSFKDNDDYYQFMFDEFAMAIFGHAGSSEYSTFNYLNEIYNNLRDEHELIIVSDEMGKSKPATLFFLSKFGCLLEQIKFFNSFTENNIINNLDILLTANPSLLLKKYDNTIVIKFETIYNKEIKCDYTISSLSEFESKLNEIKSC